MGRSQFSARRTDKLEAMIQEAWSLRRELRDKNAQTIHAGLAALIRECRRSNSTVAIDTEEPEEEITDKPETEHNADDEWD